MPNCEVSDEDMAASVVAKSDQMNAIDLVTGPIVVRIARITKGPSAEQPTRIHLEGRDGKPWLPCKSERRILIEGWKLPASAWIGRWVKLWRNPEVKWAGKPAGGIQVLEMSNIPAAFTLAVAVAKGVTVQRTIQPLAVSAAPGKPRPPIAERQIKAQAALVADGLLEAAVAEHGDITGWGHDDVDRVIAWRSEQLRIRAEAKAAAEAAMREPCADDDGAAS